MALELEMLRRGTNEYRRELDQEKDVVEDNLLLKRKVKDTASQTALESPLYNLEDRLEQAIEELKNVKNDLKKSEKLVDYYNTKLKSIQKAAQKMEKKNGLMKAKINHMKMERDHLRAEKIAMEAKSVERKVPDQHTLLSNQAVPPINFGQLHQSESELENRGKDSHLSGLQAQQMSGVDSLTDAKLRSKRNSPRCTKADRKLEVVLRLDNVSEEGSGGLVEKLGNHYLPVQVKMILVSIGLKEKETQRVSPNNAISRYVTVTNNIKSALILFSKNRKDILTTILRILPNTVNKINAFEVYVLLMLMENRKDSLTHSQFYFRYYTD